MNAIIGMTTIALSSIDDNIKVLDCLNKIKTSSRFVLGLINDILDMSKIESGKINILEERFKLEELIKNFTDIIYPQAKEKGIEFNVVLKHIKHEELLDDLLRVNQILINLLSNALKFIQIGGSISLEIEELTGNSYHDTRVRFTTIDNGIGMSEDTIKNIFIPFEQGNKTTTREFGGTGLGLSITNNLVSLMNGTIKVRSKEGEGSKFIVELPFNIYNNYILEGDKNKKSLDDLKILVVDYEDYVCEHSTSIMDRLGIQSEYVDSVNLAIKRIIEEEEKEKGFDICFIERKMPEMNGIEITKQIRKYIGFDRLSIILMSKYDLEDIEEEVREAGVDSFIKKQMFLSSIYNTIVSVRSEANTTDKKQNIIDTKYDFSTKRVMLVEDNEINMEIAVEILNFTNIQIECVENGKSALELFKKSTGGYYDLIFMDVQMPIMDGYEATRAIRALPREDAKDVVIIAMIANAFREDALESGMNDHIRKPIEPNILYSKMDMYLK